MSAMNKQQQNTWRERIIYMKNQEKHDDQTEQNCYRGEANNRKKLQIKLTKRIIKLIAQLAEQETNPRCKMQEGPSPGPSTPS